jgi:hypothetical protein
VVASREAETGPPSPVGRLAASSFKRATHEAMGRPSITIGNGLQLKRRVARPGDRLLGWDEGNGREQVLYRLGERRIRVVAVAIEQSAGDARVKLGAPRRREAVVEHLADQEMREGAAVAGVEEGVAARRLGGEVTGCREWQVDKRRRDAEVERSADDRPRLEERPRRR